MKEEKEPKEPSKSPQRGDKGSNQFQLSDKEVEANEKGAAYPNDGPFGIGMIGRKGK